jgi:hypothetical protein
MIPAAAHPGHEPQTVRRLAANPWPVAADAGAGATTDGFLFFDRITEQLRPTRLLTLTQSPAMSQCVPSAAPVR